jgi:hypothetical protein
MVFDSLAVLCASITFFVLFKKNRCNLSSFFWAIVLMCRFTFIISYVSIIMFQSEYNMRLYLSLAQQISILLIAVVWIIFCTVHYCYNSQDNPTVEKLNSSRPPGLLHSFANSEQKRIQTMMCKSVIKIRFL